MSKIVVHSEKMTSLDSSTYCLLPEDRVSYCKAI